MWTGGGACSGPCGWARGRTAGGGAATWAPSCCGPASRTGCTPRCPTEAEAKAAKKGVWAFYVEPPPEEEERGVVAGGAASPAHDGFGATLLDIIDGGKFSLLADADAPHAAAVRDALDALMAEVGDQPSMVELKKGKLVAGAVPDRSTGEVKWFRARLEERVAAGGGGGGWPPGGWRARTSAFFFECFGKRGQAKGRGGLDVIF